ncbi:hypothetical protein [Ancylomarina sp. 16SWW S1-10-2]|uniref:hypothetical protein n=1 Tax=Ancylomarina sp. 16SWW S1-10-2 TaxID=2499681 RepID=UPI0012ADE6AD|nr:hypothetical protein [Ancylomarina sp. 16SWW S1-10-2]MRT93022.1 hypothetical protein [Ancylomarina sp. 16SWW S1-10-2]
MKKIILLALIATTLVFESNAQSVQYKVITSIESIVPMGLGRSRIVEEKSPIDAQSFTTDRTDGKKSKQGKVKRKDAKVSLFSETKLLNFYSVAGINFQNIASNDALISSKINTLVADGWELAFVTSAVESDSGKGDGKGIFITRYIFKKMI